MIKSEPKQCIECGAKENLQTHHIIQKYYGGEDSVYNTKILCKECHLKSHHYEDIICKNCGKKIIQSRFNQRFCCPKCKTEFWNKEIMQGVVLSSDVREQLKSYADVHNISIGEMADKFLRQAMNPDRAPLEDIYGHDTNKSA